MVPSILVSIIVFTPLAFLVGISASAIGFAAWPLIVPLLFVGFGFDIYHAIVLSLLIDVANGAVMTGFGIAKHSIQIKTALWLAAISCLFVLPGVYLGKIFIPENKELFRGSVSLLTFSIGAIFLLRGFRIKKHQETDVSAVKSQVSGGTATRRRGAIVYPGIAGTGLLTGLIGIGGGMNYALILMVGRSMGVREAVTTGMLITCIGALGAITGICLGIDTIASPTISAVGFGSFLVVTSAFGTFWGAKITSAISEKHLHYLIGVVVIVASIAVTLQKFLFEQPQILR